MRILFHAPGFKPEPWIAGLQAQLPGASVEPWAAGSPAADYAVVWAPSQQMLDEQAGLQAIFNMGAGVDALLKLRLPAGALLVRLDDAGMSVQMAEYVCQAVIRHVRELDVYEEGTRNRQWGFRRPRERADYPVGIMGLGVLGQRVARALQGFEYPVVGWSRSARQVEGVQCFCGPDQLDAFLAASRVLVCLLPLTADTENLLDRRTLGLLQRGAYLVNVARGGHLVEADLLALLDEGQLAGATLDVLREEPPAPDHPFWGHPKITLTPHTAARTLRDDSIAQIARKIRALQAGEPIAGVVDPGRGY